MIGYMHTWNTQSIRTILGIVLLSVALYTIMPVITAYAAAPPLTPRGTCSNDPDFEIGIGGGYGLITGVVSIMQSTLNSVSQAIYTNIKSNSSYIHAVQAAAMLYIAIYGIMFTLGATAITVSDLITRAVKLSVLSVLISPSSWGTFSNYFITFFNQGTNEIIATVTGIATMPGNPMVLNAAPVFAPMDAAIQKILSAKMLVTLWSMVSPFPPYAPAGPNGLLVAILIVSGISSFLRAVINAIWVYLMAMVLKALLFGVAPIFIPFVMFSRTRHLFDNWLSQIVNACLQPIMLFAFFSFFVVLVSVMVDKILAVPVCWTGWNDGVRGAPFIEHWWRFAVHDDEIGTFVPYTGKWDFTGSESGHMFPINIGMVIMFMMIAELSVRFNAVVIEIAKDISGAATDLSGMGGSINEWFTKNNPVAKATAHRNAPAKNPISLNEIRSGAGNSQSGNTQNSFFDKGLSGMFSKGGLLEGTVPAEAAKQGGRVEAAREAAAAQVGARPAVQGVGVNTYAGSSTPLRWKRKYHAPTGSFSADLRDSIGTFLTGGRK
jgi:type IV secretory pathway VirB6-like protein